LFKKYPLDKEGVYNLNEQVNKIENLRPVV